MSICKLNETDSLSDQMTFEFPGADVTKDQMLDVPCSYCSKLVQMPEWYVKHGLKLHFCDSECFEKWKREADKEPLIRLDGHPDKRGGNWESQAQQARERDLYTCQTCGATEKELGKQLDVHHILPYRMFKSNVEANRLENLICVCHSCHRKIEAETDRSLPLFAKPKGERK